MKRLFTAIIALLLFLCFCTSASALSYDIADTGEKVIFTDENWAYEKVNVYGWELDEYIGTATEVELPWSFAKEYVTTLGDYAFNYNTTVTSIDTTSKIESIGNYAFFGCTALKSIILYDSITDIGEGCFYGDSTLTDINLDDTSITAVSAYCFAECGITELSLPATCTSIGNMAFYNCSALTKLTIPESVTEIHQDAFKGSDNVVIYCYTDSYAHQYAEANGIEYVLIDRSVEYTFILGDADGDGVVTIIDATVIQRVLVYLMDDPDGMIELRASVDGDDLNITHATKIQRYLADFAVPEPIGTEVTRVIPAPTQG